MTHLRACTAFCPPVRLACLHHVLRRCTCWFKSASSVLRASCQHPLTAFARTGAILKVSTRAVGNTLAGLLSGVALKARTQPARVAYLRPGGFFTQQHTATELGVCDCGLCVCGEPTETTSEGATFLFSLALGFVSGVCTCGNLCRITPA